MNKKHSPTKMQVKAALNFYASMAKNKITAMQEVAEKKHAGEFPATINNKALELLKNPKITARLQQGCSKVGMNNGEITGRLE